MRRAFCRLSGGWRAFGGEGRCGGAALCFPPDARGGRSMSGRGGVHGGVRRAPQGNQRETQGWEVGEKGDCAGKNRTWTDRAKGRKTAGDARRVRPRADRVWGGRNLRADGKCVWARRAESTCGVKPWIANSGRGRGVGRSGSACCPASPHSHPQISPPLRKAPRKHSRKASGASRVFFVVSACALPESPACPAEDSRKPHAPVRSSRARCSSRFQRLGPRRRSRGRSWQGKKNQL